jgi:hypothetical protein
MLQAAAIVPAVAIPSLVVASPAHAEYMGEITRSNVLTRARDWYDRNIQYSFDPDARATDYEGAHKYRRDCSGFVSMCWHTVTPGHSTRNLDEISRQIPWENLHPGDAINKDAAYPNGHCMLFEKWSGEGPGMIRAYELTSDGMGMRCATYSISWYKERGYVPRQFHRIVAG